MANPPNTQLLYTNAANQIKEGVPQRAFPFIRKAYKLKTLTQAEKIEFQILEISCYSLMDKIEKAEHLVEAIFPTLSKPQKVKTLRIIGGYYATTEKSPDIQKAINYLEKSITLDSSIGNSHSILWLISLKYSHYDIARTETLWSQLSKWQNHFQKAAIERLKTTFRLGLHSLVNDTLSFLIANHKSLSPLNYAILVGYLISAKRTEEAKKMLATDKPEFTNTNLQYDLQARLLFDNKQYKECIAFLSRLSQRSSYSYSLQAHCHDKLSEYDDAYKNYALCSDVVLKLNPQKPEWSNIVNDYKTVNIKKCNISTDKDNSDTLNLSSIPNASMAFMIGFPRSGTTLLETILDSQEQIYTLSELGTLNPVINKLKVISQKTYPYGVDQTSVTQKNLLRDEFELVLDNIIHSQQKYGDKTNKICNTQLIIDKLPLNTIHLPLIYSLYPDAKYIFSIRHPLDVVLSCYQQYFDINREMHHLITLEGCVNRYVEVMEHAEKCEQLLDINLHYIRYEDLVADLDSEINKLSRYLGIEFNDDYKNFNHHAKTKLISTPSVSQVVNPLYQSSMYKWQNYRQHLEPFMGKLEPYINKFGYRIQ